MAGKLSWEIDLKGGETVAQKIRDLKKEIASGSGISAADLVRATGGNFSSSFIARNPDLINQINRPPVIPRPAKSGSVGRGGRAGQLASFLGVEPGSPLGNVINGLAAFRIALWEIQPIVKALQFAFKQFLDAIERGSKLYTDSARLGTSQFGLARARNVGDLLNISPDEIERMLAQGQFGIRRNAGSGTSRGTSSRTGAAIGFFGNTFGGRGAEQLSQLQQLNNLQKEALAAWKLTADASLVSAMSAKTLFYGSFSLKLLMEDLKSFIEVLSAIMTPFIAGLAYLVHLYMVPALQELQLILGTAQKLGILPTGGTFSHSLGAGQRLPVSNFERLGFHFGSPGVHASNAPQRTAAATEKTVGLLTRIEMILQARNAQSLAHAFMNSP